jgi:hypothetical protein
MMSDRALERRVRAGLAVFVLGLVLSGLTAFPLETEVRWLHQWLTGPGAVVGERWPDLVAWVARVAQALTETSERHPFLAYGTDWLAFAHLVIAIAFWGPFKDPIRNVWVVEWGMLACLAVVPLALVCGHARGIPMFWRAIDMSFGVFGLMPLLLVRRDIRRLEVRKAPML